MSEFLAISPADTISSKALLLCAHAEELSVQCAIVLRAGESEILEALQARKFTVIAELTTILPDRDLAQLPVFQRAILSLRKALLAEMHAIADASRETQSELATVNAAQRRLAHARQYDTGAQPPRSADGGQLSLCG